MKRLIYHENVIYLTKEGISLRAVVLYRPPGGVNEFGLAWSDTMCRSLLSSLWESFNSRGHSIRPDLSIQLSTPSVSSDGKHYRRSQDGRDHAPEHAKMQRHWRETVGEKARAMPRESKQMTARCCCGRRNGNGVSNIRDAISLTLDPLFYAPKKAWDSQWRQFSYATACPSVRSSSPLPFKEKLNAITRNSEDDMHSDRRGERITRLAEREKFVFSTQSRIARPKPAAEGKT